MTRPCPLSATVGGYLLGVLDPQDTENFRRHAEDCLCCRREITYLAPVARFLEAFKTVVRTSDAHEQFSDLAVLLGYARADGDAVPAPDIAVRCRHHPPAQ